MSATLEQPWVRFRVSADDYALPLDRVVEVTVARTPRLIPFVSPEVAGVINVKGEPLPAVNAGRILRGEATRPNRHTIVLEKGTTRIGLLVEVVLRIEQGLIRPGQDSQEPPEKALGEPDFVSWFLVNGKRVGLVDSDALLGCIVDQLAGQAQVAQQRGEEAWPSAF
jgi:chemotaxis signal transduction protein